jgi:DDE superfamily endonuclease
VSAGVATPAPHRPLLREPFASVPEAWPALEHEVVNPANPAEVAWVGELLTTGQADLYAQDEADLCLLPTLTRTWMLRGEQLKLRAPGSPNAKRSVSAATDLGEGVTLWRTDERRNTRQFALTLIACVKRSNARSRVAVLLIDNAPGHRLGKTGCLRQVMDVLRGRAVLVYLPAYSPDLQPEERLWRQWRPNVTHNHRRATIEALIQDSDAWFERLDEHPASTLQLLGLSFPRLPECLAA